MTWRGLLGRLAPFSAAAVASSRLPSSSVAVLPGRHQTASAAAVAAATSSSSRSSSLAARGLSTNAAVSESTSSHQVDEPLEAREMHEVMSRKERIRMSPWKINLLARQIRGLPVVEALMQLKFSRKQKGPPIVAKVIQNAANLANIRHNLNPEDLVVAEAFVNRANIQKGVMIHGRGRFGLKLRRYSHVVVRLKEVDFEAALRACTNRFQRARWEQRRKLAEDVRRARSEEGGGGPSSA